MSVRREAGAERERRVPSGRALWLAIGLAALLTACGGNTYMTVGTTIPMGGWGGGWGGIHVGTTVPIGGRW